MMFKNVEVSERDDQKQSEKQTISIYCNMYNPYNNIYVIALPWS